MRLLSTPVLLHVQPMCDMSLLTHGAIATSMYTQELLEVTAPLDIPNNMPPPPWKTLNLEAS